MARPLRLEHEDALWHVTSRGNEKKDIFRDDLDRERFVLMLSQSVIRFGWRLLSWVLMSNHYHLIIQTPQPNLSRGMHWLNGRYAQWFNRRHERCGHLFQGRFHGALIDKDSYFLSVVRYVVLNPVRAGLVDRPDEWRWSSYRQSAGLELPKRWLAVEELLHTFGGANLRGCEEYVRFVNAADASPSPWNHVVAQIYLGSPEWLERINERVASTPRSREHPHAQTRPIRLAMNDVIAVVAKTFDTTPDQLRTGSRREAMARSIVAFLAFEDGLYTQGEIAAVLQVRSPSTASGMVRRCRQLFESSIEIEELINACRRLMPQVPTSSSTTSINRGYDHDERFSSST
jgi:putative transposase